MVKRSQLKYSTDSFSYVIALTRGRPRFDLSASRGKLLFLLLFFVFQPKPAGAEEAHYDGERFFNPSRLEQHAGMSVKLPFFFRRFLGVLHQRSGAPPQVHNDGAFLRSNASHSVPTATWVGHSTVIVQMDGVTFITDPIWSDTASPVSFLGPRRLVPPGVAIDDLPLIDFVLISHDHYDHTDLYSLKRLAAKGTWIFVPLKLDGFLRRSGISRVKAFDWWDQHYFKGVEIHCLPAQHSSGRRSVGSNRTLWSGWAVTGPSRRFFYPGDTGYFDGFSEVGKRLGPFQLAAVPIGAYEPQAMMRYVHLTPEQALRAALDVQAKTIMGIHYGTFDLTDEPLAEPARRFHKEASRLGLPSERVWTLKIGETRIW